MGGQSRTDRGPPLLYEVEPPSYPGQTALDAPYTRARFRKTACTKPSLCPLPQLLWAIHFFYLLLDRCGSKRGISMPDFKWSDLLLAKKKRGVLSFAFRVFVIGRSRACRFEASKRIGPRYQEWLVPFNSMGANDASDPTCRAATCSQPASLLSNPSPTDGLHGTRANRGDR